MTNRLHAFAVRYTATWCSQDAASVASFFSPDGSLTINDGVPTIGRSAIAEAAQGFMTAFPDPKVYMDDLVEVQDILDGIEHAPDSIAGLYRGKNLGKRLIRIASEQ